MHSSHLLSTYYVPGMETSISQRHLTPLSRPLGWVFCWNHHFSDKETGSAGGRGSTYMGGSRTHSLSIQVKVAGWSLEQESVTPSRICLCPFPPCTTALPPGRPRTSLILLGLLLKFCPACRCWCPLSSALISWTEPRQGCSLPVWHISNPSHFPSMWA